ncbi:MAG: hypothetical protein QOH60_5138 [Mycobacterium sp.]|nr:hypothetical protein [Mycobacterium sp.]
MTATTGLSMTGVPRSNAGRPVEFSGALVRARCHHAATVVTITGNIKSANIEQIASYCGRLTLAGKPMVLDVSGAHGSGALCVRLVNILDAQCNNAGIELVIVPSDAVADQLDGACGGSVSIVTSEQSALNYFADGLRARRQILLPLFAKTA